MNDSEARAFATHLRKLRTAHGLTQQQLADDADIERSTLTRLEGAKLNVTLDMVFTLAKALNLHPKDLFDFELPEGAGT